MIKTLEKIGAGFLVVGLAALGFASPNSAYAAEPQASVKTAVLAAEQKWVNAVLHGDGATLDKMMANDIMYTHSSAMIQTKDQFIKAATSGSTKYLAFDFSDTVVRQYGKTVVISHKTTTKTVQTGEAHLFVSEVWFEQNGGWQMVSRQATKLPQ